MERPPIVALLTAFGTRDGYAGVMKGVILGIMPACRLVDITHDIPPQDVRAGAWALSTAWRYFPEGTIFLCVVDPGVGSERRPIAIRAGGRLFVGPDNGIFSYVLAGCEPERAVMLDKPLYHLPLPSATFHGRDIFSPCAGHLARGILLDAVGSVIAPDSLVTLALPQPRWEDAGTLIGHVVHTDHFGNLISDFDAGLTRAILAAPGVELHIAGRAIAATALTFAGGPEGEPFALRDSSGHLALAVRNGSAAALLGAGEGDEIRVIGLRREGDGVNGPAGNDVGV